MTDHKDIKVGDVVYVVLGDKLLGDNLKLAAELIEAGVKAAEWGSGALISCHLNEDQARLLLTALRWKAAGVRRETGET